MPIAGSDLVHYESAATSSTGGAIGASTITSGVKNNLWPDVNDAERVAGVVRYRKTFWKNANLTDSAAKPCIYIPVFPSNATLAIGLGANASSDDDPAQGNMSAFGAPALVALVSDGADTRQATIRGMDSAGTSPLTEIVTLTGTSEALSVAQFSDVWSVTLDGTSGTRTVTVKQGSGGTTRGTIGVNKITCWLWVSAGTAKANGIYCTDLAAGQAYGVWHKLTVTAGATATKPNTTSLTIEES